MRPCDSGGEENRSVAEPGEALALIIELTKKS